MKSQIRLMGLLTVLIAFSIAFSAKAAELACWNMYSPRGSRPILTADIVEGTTLTNAQLNLKDKWFENYIVDETRDAGENWGHKPEHKLSQLVQPPKALEASLIVSNRTPYKGNNEYNFKLGQYSFRSPYYNTQGEYGARLILPTDLSPDSLRAFRIRTPSERSNAVMIVPPEYDSNQGGNNYLRMFCVSK